MFMQAAFAIVETGTHRAKNANDTMMMNFMVSDVRLVRLPGMRLRDPDGQRGGKMRTLGGVAPLNTEYEIHLFGNDWGLFGMRGFFLSGHTYHVGVMELFLFQMASMDTALDHRDRFGRRALEVCRLLRIVTRPRRDDLSAVGPLGLGRWLARKTGSELGLGRGLR